LDLTWYDVYAGANGRSIGEARKHVAIICS